LQSARATSTVRSLADFRSLRALCQEFQVSISGRIAADQLVEVASLPCAVSSLDKEGEVALVEFIESFPLRFSCSFG
jgi:hypothetical protein